MIDPSLLQRSLAEWVGYALLAVVPGLVWLWYFWRRDRFEPEPRALVLKVFAWGALMVPLASGLEWAAQEFLPAARGMPWWEDLRLLLMAFVVVALVEELLKFLVVRIRMMPDPEFDEPMDGIIYAVAAGLGFATAENLVYIFRFGATVLIVRVVFSVFLHAGCSGICGYYLGRAKFEPERALRHQALGLSLAIGIHGLYDFLVFRRYFWGLILIMALLYLVKAFLDLRVGDALVDSPFRPADMTDAEIRGEDVEETQGRDITIP